MSLQIDRGLAKFDYVDHHAILGVPINAGASEIRKRYLRIARSLHPDSRGEAVNLQLANQLLSKLVNPAYEFLSQEKDRAEYEVLLRLLGQRLANERQAIVFEEGLAKEILKSRELDSFYQQAVQQLAEKQYQSLNQVLELTGQLSELNMAYLLCKAGKAELGSEQWHNLSASSTPPAGAKPTTSMTSSKSTTPPGFESRGKSTTPPAESFVSQYCRRAEELLAKNSFQLAILELRDALKLDPNNSRCHSLMGTIYLKQNQLTMAKVHFNQALRFDPQDLAAINGKEKITKLEQKAQKAKMQQSPPQKPGSGGLFGLFGGRKK